MSDTRTTNPMRQLMRCPRLPAVERVGASKAKGWPVPDSDYTTEVCPTYAVSMPEVHEAAECFPQWKERTLTEYLGEPPTPELLMCLAALGNAASARDAWKMKEAAEARTKGDAP